MSSSADAVVEQQSRPTPSPPRPQAFDAAKALLDSFDARPFEAPDEAVDSKPTSAPGRERQCLGHRERILGMDVSECGRYIATASQDATVRVWNVAKNTLLSTLQATGSTDYECLRVAWASSSWGQDRMNRNTVSGDDSSVRKSHRHLLATGGANGIVQLWSCSDLSGDSVEFESLETLDHASYSHFEPVEEGDKPQVYALQFIDHWKALPNDADLENSFLLTSSDDHIHLWELDDAKKARSNEEGSKEQPVYLREVLSFRFGDMHEAGYGVAVCQVTGSGIHLPTSVGGLTRSAGSPAKQFGGARNPSNLVYVFDASYCSANALLGVALSDGSLRLLNGRGVCLTVLSLPGVNSHLTSFAWDEAGQRLATTVATGQLITWSIHIDDSSTHPTSSDVMSLQQHTSCRAVFEGGHEPGRPLFGAHYVGEDLLLSWGVDGRLCLWDSQSTEEVYQPLSVLVDKRDYPIYACSCSYSRDDGEDGGVVAIAGGGNDGGFIGIPVLLYHVVAKPNDHQQKKARTGDDLQST